jgi:hypothetical protein
MRHLAELQRLPLSTPRPNAATPERISPGNQTPLAQRSRCNIQAPHRMERHGR